MILVISFFLNHGITLTILQFSCELSSQSSQCLLGGTSCHVKLRSRRVPRPRTQHHDNLKKELEITTKLTLTFNVKSLFSKKAALIIYYILLTYLHLTLLLQFFLKILNNPFAHIIHQCFRSRALLQNDLGSLNRRRILYNIH